MDEREPTTDEPDDTEGHGMPLNDDTEGHGMPPNDDVEGHGMAAGFDET
jgi:hypothetical protein